MIIHYDIDFSGWIGESLISCQERNQEKRIRIAIIKAGKDKRLVYLMSYFVHLRGKQGAGNVYQGGFSIAVKIDVKGFAGSK